MLTPAGAASGAGRAAGIPIVSPAPAVLVLSLVLAQPRNSPGQTLPEQGLLRDPFHAPAPPGLQEVAVLSQSWGTVWQGEVTVGWWQLRPS